MMCTGYLYDEQTFFNDMQIYIYMIYKHTNMIYKYPYVVCKFTYMICVIILFACYYKWVQSKPVQQVDMIFSHLEWSKLTCDMI